jgi:hypothetical protein
MKSKVENKRNLTNKLQRKSSIYIIYEFDIMVEINSNNFKNLDK